ncbi:MAG TPA: hypothetical protein VFI33_01715 [Puia sp.]|nr:hypothetical protein [Puia sp.]
MAQMKVGVQIAWLTGGLLFVSILTGIICNRSTGKIQTANNTVYNYIDSPKLKVNNTVVNQKISEPSNPPPKVIPAKTSKSSSKYNIHAPRKISEKEIMSDMKKYFPDKTISVEFVAFDRADAEVTHVKNRIAFILRKNGYKNIEEKFHLKTGAVVPEKIVLDTIPGKHSISFSIPPAN